MWNVGGTGADAAGAKSSEEGSTVVLVRYSHLGGIGREGDQLKRWRRRNGLHERSRARGRTAGGEKGVREGEERGVERQEGTDVE